MNRPGHIPTENPPGPCRCDRRLKRPTVVEGRPACLECGRPLGREAILQALEAGIFRLEHAGPTVWQIHADGRPAGQIQADTPTQAAKRWLRMHYPQAPADRAQPIPAGPPGTHLRDMPLDEDGTEWIRLTISPQAKS